MDRRLCPLVSCPSSADYVLPASGRHPWRSSGHHVNPRVRQFGGQPASHGRITKAGSAHARGMLVEAAWSASKAPGPLPARVLPAGGRAAGLAGRGRRGRPIVLGRARRYRPMATERPAEGLRTSCVHDVAALQLRAVIRPVWARRAVAAAGSRRQIRRLGLSSLISPIASARVLFCRDPDGPPPASLCSAPRCSRGLCGCGRVRRGGHVAGCWA